MTADETTAQLDALCFGAHAPADLARFWARALRWEVGDTSAAAVDLVPIDGTRFTLRFRPSATPKLGPNPLHLDLTTTSVTDQQQSVATLLQFGGRHIDIGQRGNEDHVVLADPEGNELCIIEPTNNFLSTCGRFGSITCDGTRAVGYFWSAVLGWPLVWDQDEETAIRAPDGSGPLITWGGPPLAPKLGRNRLHLEIRPPAAVELESEVRRIVALGATRVDGGRGDADSDVDWVELRDVDGNEFRVLDHE